MKRMSNIKDAIKLDSNIVMRKAKTNNSIWNKETIDSLSKSENDIENNRTKDAVEFIEELKVKYGF